MSVLPGTAAARLSKEAKYEDAKHKILAASYGLGGQNLRALFRKVDTDGGGDLQFEEFHKACRTYLKIGKQQLSDRELQDLFVHIDSLGDGDGNLSIDELLDFIGDKLPQHEIDAREKARRAAEDAQRAADAKRQAELERERAFERRRREANPKLLMKFRVAVKTVRAMIRWNNIFMETRYRGVVYILDADGSCLHLLGQTLDHLLYKKVIGTSESQLWDTMLSWVKDEKINNGILFSGIFVHDNTLERGLAGLQPLREKLEEFAKYHDFTPPTVVYYSSVQDASHEHENIHMSTVERMRHKHEQDSIRAALPKGVCHVKYPFAAGTIAKVLAQTQGQKIGFSSQWANGESKSHSRSAAGALAAAQQAAADSKRGLDADALDDIKSSEEEESFIKRYVVTPGVTWLASQLCTGAILVVIVAAFCFVSVLLVASRLAAAVKHTIAHRPGKQNGGPAISIANGTPHCIMRCCAAAIKPVSLSYLRRRTSSNPNLFFPSHGRGDPQAHSRATRIG